MKTKFTIRRLFLVVFLLGAFMEMNAQVTVVRRGAVVVRRPYVRPVPPPPPVVRVPVVRPVAWYPRPLPGVVVTTLPVHYTVCYAGVNPYYYSDGIYYVKEAKTDAYKVVRPPVGTIVPALPEDAKQNVLDGKVYFEFQTVIYKEIETEEGVRFEVVGYSEN
ncbi:hypothetical protein GM418_13415 [Maribellus comscasis]|uniref:Uncharacterized protein n=1 Tax=Maribellus comscasis TaxID=2681766 RepID=A0A6I6JNV9_9BACT|nr:DUF6515 family protein [Maribellus comscasis]QGY44625.1 hypothetical protein GM418_13415 [Maribellus comscasis]